MKRIASVLLVLFVTACTDKSDVVQSMMLSYTAIEQSAKTATTLLNQDQISVEAACKVREYAGLSKALTDEAYVTWIEGNPEGAIAQLDAATAALNGFSIAAQEQASGACANVGG